MIQNSRLITLILLICCCTTARGSIENWFFDYAVGNSTVQYNFYDPSGNKFRSLTVDYYGEYRKDKNEYLTVVSELTAEGEKTENPIRTIWRKEDGVIIGRPDSETDPNNKTFMKLFIEDAETMRYELWTPDWLAVEGKSKVVGDEIHSKETGFNESGAVLFTTQVLASKEADEVRQPE